MKKFTILTSLLALTACGGGSGGGSAPASVSLSPDLTVGLDKMSFETTDGDTLKFNIENGNIVSMTEIEEDGSKMTYAHTDGNKFKINNVRVYEAGVDSDDIRDMLHDQYDITYTEDIATGVSSTKELNPTERKALLIEQNLTLMKKNGVEITDEVRAAVTGVINGIDSWNTFLVNSATMNIESMGKNLKLAYSDFGTITTDYDFTYDGQHDSDTDHELYTAGYNKNKVEKPNTDMTFAGAAIASIQKFGSDDTMLSKTNYAALTVDNSGKETLTMNFTKAANPWYDVKITKDGTYPTVEINVNDAATAKIKKDDFKATADMTQQWSGGKNGSKGLVTSYYGADGKATEAIATSQFGLADTTYHNGMHVEAVFGGKAK